MPRPQPRLAPATTATLPFSEFSTVRRYTVQVLGTKNDAGLISARLDRLPATRAVWTRVFLLSLGGFFEFYDLFFTGYIAPGLVRSHILTATTRGLFGTTGV